MTNYYKGMKLKDITKPKYRHLFFLLFWVAYFTAYALVENLVVPKYDIHTALDDVIPFCEFFIIPYVLWYLLLAFVSLYTLFFDIPAFKKFYKFLIVTCIVTFAIYVIFPNEQNLRPTDYGRDNIFVDIVKFLHGFDTNTNVFPSMHVIFSVGMLFTMWSVKPFNGVWGRVVSTLLAISICLATVHLKQHSILDVYSGVALSVLVFPFIYLDLKGKFKKLKKE